MSTLHISLCLATWWGFFGLDSSRRLNISAIISMGKDVSDIIVCCGDVEVGKLLIIIEEWVKELLGNYACRIFSL